jgi:hypothetical protein
MQRNSKQSGLPKGGSATGDGTANRAMPDVFAETLLQMDLYPKQREVLRALGLPGSFVSFRSCNEGGKTKRVICAAILWHLLAFPRGHIISTSGSYRQIKDQLLPALHTYSSRFPNWTFLRTPRIDTQDINCFWEGFSTNDAGKFEGHHAGSPDEPLMIIVDEAKTVKDEIFQAIERCKPTRLLIASSPGYAEGEFYRSQTTKASFTGVAAPPAYSSNGLPSARTGSQRISSACAKNGARSTRCLSPWSWLISWNQLRMP